MKLEISKLKLFWKCLTGGAAGLGTYALELGNAALASIDATNKQSIQAVLNYMKKVLNTLKAFAWLIPTKWQTAFEKTIKAVEDTATALEDLQLTQEELANILATYTAAVDAWKSGDDETCQDCPDGACSEKECTDEE